MGVRYIQAVKTTGYRSATSGKNTASADSNSATPKENENKKSIYTGSSRADGLSGTPVIAKIKNSGTRDSTKLTILAMIVDTTNDDLGT